MLLVALRCYCMQQYDKSHPSAVGLEGFDSSEMAAPVFKEMVRRTFGLKLRAKEVGALVRHLSKNGGDTVRLMNLEIIYPLSLPAVQTVCCSPS